MTVLLAAGISGLAGLAGCRDRRPQPTDRPAPSVAATPSAFVSDCGEYTSAVAPLLDTWTPKLEAARRGTPADLRALVADADWTRSGLDRMHPRDAAAGTHLLRVRGTLRDVGATLAETADAREGVGGNHNMLQLAQLLEDRIRELADEKQTLTTLCPQ
ncbi:MAG: hypothetical protein NVS3B10_16720 [Polyangiales bacterium]